MENPSLEEKLNSEINLLSAVTNQPVLSFYKNPVKFDGNLSDELSFNCRLYLGNMFDIKFWQTFRKEKPAYNRCWFVDSAGYEVRNNNCIISRSSYSSSESFEESDLKMDSCIIDRLRLNFLLNEIKGIDVENPEFMNYEHYTLDSLKDRDSYFKSIYLAIMCYLKEKGVKLAPILSKDNDIRKLMYKGDIESLDDILKTRLLEIKSEYNQGMYFHASYESDKIREFALKRRQYHDKTIPLIEKMIDWNIKTIKGNGQKRTYNILIVEDFGAGLDDLGTLDLLSQKVYEELEKLNKYQGSNIFSTCNICDCIEICGTGQIDAILMDGGQYHLGNAEEIAMMNGLRVESSIKDNPVQIPNLDGFSEKKYWRKIIFENIIANGHSPPPCLIIPKNIMNMAVGNFVSEMLERK
jgi:hypothetical protein